MKDSLDPPSMRDELRLSLRLREGDCRSSWQDLTSCQILLPPRSDPMIRVYGGSGTDQVLFQSTLDLPISTIGQIGQIPWNPSTQLPTVVSIVIAVGQTEFTLAEKLALTSFDLDYCVSRRPTRNRDSLPRSRVRISGVSKMLDTTSTLDVKEAGLTIFVDFTTKVLTSAFARLGLGMARWLPLIYQRLVTEFPVTSWGRCFGRTRDY
jgi:hypothetical protein